MFASQLGIRLILWVGETVPRPAPVEVSAALRRVEVTNDAGAGDGFQMTLMLGRDRVADYSLLRGGALNPFKRVIIGVLMGATPAALIDGIITHHQVTPGGGDAAGQSTLTVTGRDVGLMLDLTEKNAPFQNQPDFLIVTQLLASYAQYGLVPRVTPTTDVPLMIERIPRQRETDLRLIQRLAKKNGFVFYIEPLTFGVNTAYWGPENRLGIPQSALTIDMGASTNVRRLNFANDGLAPVAPEGSFVEPITKTSLPIPPLPALHVPPLAASIASPKRSVVLRDAANLNPLQALLGALGAAKSAPPAVSGEGELDAVRYGAVLRARRLVGVRGAGFSYDGNYFVNRVTHTITLGAYTQVFTISREGTGTLLPVVIP
ncbi:MAG: phage late control D family protein [Acidobacteriota bacterium]|nr:phage late control D family protein [Acidobacteriota bacterium]